MLLKKFSEFNYEAGIDEAGRGCLAGPLTAAAVKGPARLPLPASSTPASYLNFENLFINILIKSNFKRNLTLV